jgi:hypothetical protein
MSAFAYAVPLLLHLSTKHKFVLRVFLDVTIIGASHPNPIPLNLVQQTDMAF